MMDKCTSVVMIPMVGCCEGMAKRKEEMSVILLDRRWLSAVLLEAEMEVLAVERCYISKRPRIALVRF